MASEHGSSRRDTPGRGEAVVRGSERHPAERDAEFADRLREGGGHADFYDAFAPALYEYCWVLLGPGGLGDEHDRAGAAVHEALVAAVELLDHLPDRFDLRPWLFALARAACERRRLAPQSPYTRLATAREERAFVEVARRLPPSHRELLELYLRHGLAPSQIATVLALEPDTAGELCRAAVRRAVEVLGELAPGPDRPGTTQWALVDVAELMAGFTPPGPPRSLRAGVLADATGAADGAAGRERRRAANAMRPLGENGFPLHCERPGVSAPGADDDHDEHADRAPGPPVGDSTGVARDRVTTADVPSGRDEPVAELSPAGRGGRDDEPGDDSRSWRTPAAAGLLTVAIAVGLWLTGTSLVGGPGLIAGGTPPDAAAPLGVHGTAGQVTPDQLPPPADKVPESPTPRPPAAVDPSGGSRTTDDTAEAPAAPQPEPEAPQDPPADDGDGPDAPDDPDDPKPPFPTPPDDPPDDDHRGVVDRLLEDLGDLLGGGRR